MQIFVYSFMFAAIFHAVKASLNAIDRHYTTNRPWSRWSTIRAEEYLQLIFCFGKGSVKVR